MKPFYFIILICIFVITNAAIAQSNGIAGTWQRQNEATGQKLTLQIANAVHKVWYPAHLTFTEGSTVAGFDLLLIKKNSSQLAISKAKYSDKYKSDSFAVVKNFNGILILSRDLKGQAILHQQPITLNESNEGARLVKINDSAWADAAIDKIVEPSVSPEYFGITDSIVVDNRNGTMAIAGLQKDDIVSASLNGITMLDLFSPTKKIHTEDVSLDTGWNILALFADKFGNSARSKTKASFTFGHQTFKLDFNRSQDSGAAFICAKIFCTPQSQSDTYFKAYPAIDTDENNANKNIIAGISTTSGKVRLAIWDDAVEDGDSISIKINGEWLARGLPVKKKPQFINVMLKPGKNTIHFFADNVGSIPPNTSILEIIDGNKRKAFTLDALPGEQHFMKIFYDTESIKK